jgi:pimeloyl-ACP methyl ester carboxylesterase
MLRWGKLSLALVLVLTFAPVVPGLAQSGIECDYYGLHANGAKYCITLPPEGYWNGDLVIFAHGYVSVREPLEIPWDQLILPDGSPMPAIVNSLGYAFATTSYSENGLAVVRGIIDILDLVDVFNNTVGYPNRVYLIGASEGGLVTTLAIEEHPGPFVGGMALCGPIGGFRGQVNYWGDFRVVFDYFFPGLLPPSPINIPDQVMDNWETAYVPSILAALSDPSNQLRVMQLLNVTQAPVDPLDPSTVPQTVLGVLWYNIFATNNGIEKLRGQPFGNVSVERFKQMTVVSNKWYLGSLNDAALNQGVERFIADDSALNTMDKKYETSGRLKKPLVTLHTTGDPIVPYWHALKYNEKVLLNSKGGAYLHIPVERYGHCSFELPEILAGFNWLVLQSTGQPLNLAALPLDAAAQAKIYELSQEVVAGE